jgi:hypothetical protein
VVSNYCSTSLDSANGRCWHMVDSDIQSIPRIRCAGENVNNANERIDVVLVTCP